MAENRRASEERAWVGDQRIGHSFRECTAPRSARAHFLAMSAVLVAVVTWMSASVVGPSVAVPIALGVLALVAWRCGRMGVCWDDRSVHVANVTRRYVIELADIEDYANEKPWWVWLARLGAFDQLALRVRGRRRMIFVSATFGNFRAAGGLMRALESRAAHDPERPQSRTVHTASRRDC